MQISSESLNSTAKEAVGHRSVKQGGDDATMQDAVIPLQVRASLESRTHGSVIPGLETQSQ